MQESLRLVLLTLVFAVVTLGQPFSSGSTGVDGALDLTYGDRNVVLPDSGILNYTTVNIPEGRTLTFASNRQNTPVVILAQGAVILSGTINIAGSGQIPGPGGFYGGGALQDGFGPGAGVMAGQRNGSWVGPLSLVPIVGGSGSASAGVPNYYCVNSLGGGGGGAIVIASSASITMPSTGSINAIGGSAVCSSVPWSFQAGAGAIRLVANSLTVGGGFSAAIVRLEAPLNALTYTGSGTVPVRSTINPIIVPASPPQLTIQSIGGYTVPSYSGSSLSTIDLLLPNQLPDPIPVIVQAKNVPVGSPITIKFNGSLTATATTATLTGTMAMSTATLYISGLTRSALTYLFVMATFDPTVITSNLKYSDREVVSKIEIAAAVGGSATYRFLDHNGRGLDLSMVPAELRRAFGL